MTTEVNNYRLYCITESAYVSVWGTVEPTKCPNDSSHNIDTNSTVIVQTISTSTVKVEEDSDGYFESENIEINVPAGSPGDITTYDITWPMNVTLWKTLLTPTNDMIGDTLNVLASPETTLGVITSSTSIGSTTIPVNSTVTENIYRGFLVTLDDGVNKNVCGRCINVDKAAGTISFETATTSAYTTGAQVKISIYVLKDIRIIDTKTIEIGDKGFKGKNIPAGMIMRIYYTNNSGTAKTFFWRPEIYNRG